MELLPAIDLRQGSVVRLRRGDDGARTRYDDRPLAVLARFAAAGARRVHVVDLDAAFGEQPQRRLLEDLAGSTALALQLGGGVRDRAAVEWALDAGFERVVMGSLVAQDTVRFLALAAAFPDRLVAALEFESGELRVAGWREAAVGVAAQVTGALRGAPLAAALVTDVERDGMLAGPNLDLCQRVAVATGLPVLVSGGVRSLADLRAVRARGFAGAVVGRALYESSFALEDAFAAMAAEALA